MGRTRVSAAGAVCRDRWGEEFKNRWVFSLLAVSLLMGLCLYKLNFRICQNTLEQLDLEFTCYNLNNCIPRLCVCCFYIVIQMNFHCACLLLNASSVLSTATYPALACCLYQVVLVWELCWFTMTLQMNSPESLRFFFRSFCLYMLLYFDTQFLALEVLQPSSMDIHDR